MAELVEHGGTSKLQTEAQFLKGVGPKWSSVMAKLGLRTVEDVLFHFPRRYEDRRHLPPLSQLQPGQFVTARGELKKVETRPLRGGKVIIRAVVSDGTGEVTLVWFNQPWIKRKLEAYREEILAYGMVRVNNYALEIHSPEIELIEDEEDQADFAKIVPVYGLTEGLPQKVMRRAAESALTFYLSMIQDPLPVAFLKAHGLRPLPWSLSQIHQPTDEVKAQEARKRLVFEEFFYMQLETQMRRKEAKQELGISFDLRQAKAPGSNLFGEQLAPVTGSLWDEVHKMLPFELTGAQKRVIQEIWDDMQRPIPMNRLVQGDVGSGKTAVAACAMLAAVRCGYQTALMAPTEILADQHYINLHRLFDPLGIQVVLLTGKLPAQRRRKATTQAANGEAQIVVGTHALVEEAVKFHRLGLAVIDEQHRFGVLQRASLRNKGEIIPDVLVMTATPIPRTLTMTMHGDLDVSIIDELPPGRKPIKTHWRRPNERSRVYEGVRKLVEEGRQAYFVCPMISESDKMQTQAAEDLYYRLGTETYPDLKIGLLHGQMKPAEKEEVMLQFRSGELNILVSTVVIEVGVDVPNATTMVIEDANRFGLAQLHQLRGRVGRGGHQSYCILIAEATSEETSERLRIMTETNDGFRIAEADLRLRGPGEIAGTKQSGNLDFRLADLIRDSVLLEQARSAAIDLLERDPSLIKTEHQAILNKVKQSRSEVALITVS
ncbi:MAG: ATP-dependent DNA helicase RecG [Armatimonadetes bacterium]|nr:ATP-dependent DNA helicase RecG [Armatimonadota bacterium]